MIIFLLMLAIFTRYTDIYCDEISCAAILNLFLSSFFRASVNVRIYAMIKIYIKYQLRMRDTKRSYENRTICVKVSELFLFALLLTLGQREKR